MFLYDVKRGYTITSKSNQRWFTLPKFSNANCIQLNLYCLSESFPAFSSIQVNHGSRGEQDTDWAKRHLLNAKLLDRAMKDGTTGRRDDGSGGLKGFGHSSTNQRIIWGMGQNLLLPYDWGNKDNKDPLTSYDLCYLGSQGFDSQPYQYL